MRYEFFIPNSADIKEGLDRGVQRANVQLLAVRTLARVFLKEQGARTLEQTEQLEGEAADEFARRAFVCGVECYVAGALMRRDARRFLAASNDPDGVARRLDEFVERLEFIES